MLFIHAGVHQARYRQLVTQPRWGSSHEPPSPLLVRCPYCGDIYIADKETHPGRPDLGELARLAVAALAHDCPDHRHYMEIG